MSASPNHDAEKLVTIPPFGHQAPSPVLSGKISSTPSSTDSLSSSSPEGKAFLRASDGESDGDLVFLNGEPVVVTGRDVSRFVVDIRDDGDDALTFRSFVIGTVLAGLGATLCQVCHPHKAHNRALMELWQIYLFKPLQMTVSTVFLLLVNYTFGNAWAKCLPRRTTVEGTPFEFLAPTLGFINPGAFKLKEVGCISCL